MAENGWHREQGGGWQAPRSKAWPASGGLTAAAAQDSLGQVALNTLTHTQTHSPQPRHDSHTDATLARPRLPRLLRLPRFLCLLCLI